MTVVLSLFVVFFFNDTATTEIYTLSLHDALPISLGAEPFLPPVETATHAAFLFEEIAMEPFRLQFGGRYDYQDRKSTRLNSSHANISYAVFCLKKKNT